jgi:hypothetical protein
MIYLYIYDDASTGWSESPPDDTNLEQIAAGKLQVLVLSDVPRKVYEDGRIQTQTRAELEAAHAAIPGFGFYSLGGG